MVAIVIKGSSILQQQHEATLLALRGLDQLTGPGGHSYLTSHQDALHESLVWQEKMQRDVNDCLKGWGIG
jgi:hypothetical protein